MNLTITLTKHETNFRPRYSDERYKQTGQLSAITTEDTQEVDWIFSAFQLWTPTNNTTKYGKLAFSYLWISLPLSPSFDWNAGAYGVQFLHTCQKWLLAMLLCFLTIAAWRLIVSLSSPTRLLGPSKFSTTHTRRANCAETNGLFGWEVLYFYQGALVRSSTKYQNSPPIQASYKGFTAYVTAQGKLGDLGAVSTCIGDRSHFHISRTRTGQSDTSQGAQNRLDKCHLGFRRYSISHAAFFFFFFFLSLMLTHFYRADSYPSSANPTDGKSLM